MATDFYQAWSHRWGGIATLEFSINGGATQTVSTSASVAADRDFCHLSLTSVTRDERDASAEDLGYSDFASWLQAKIRALTSGTETVTFSTSTLLYTITADGGETIAITFPATAAGTRMRRILGFTANKAAAASQTSDMRPWYVVRATIDGRTNYRPPAVRQGQVKVARADNGRPYVLHSTSLVKSARWEHHFEPKAAMRRHDAVADTLAGGASWTWEDALEHAARYAVPCVVRDDDGSMVFYTSTPLEEGVTRLNTKSYLGQQIVVVSADAIAGYL